MREEESVFTDRWQNIAAMKRAFRLRGLKYVLNIFPSLSVIINYDREGVIQINLLRAAKHRQFTSSACCSSSSRSSCSCRSLSRRLRSAAWSRLALICTISWLNSGLEQPRSRAATDTLNTLAWDTQKERAVEVTYSALRS